MKQQLDEICQELIEYFGWKKDTLYTLNHQEAFLAKNVFLALENNNTLSAITQLYGLIEERGGYQLSFSSFTHLTLPRDFSLPRIKYFKSYLDTVGKIVELYERCCNETGSTSVLSSFENRETIGDAVVKHPITASALKDAVEERFKVYRYRGTGSIERGDVYRIDPFIHLTNDLNRWIREKHSTSNEQGLIDISIIGSVSLLENTGSDFLFVISKQESIWIAFDSGVFQKRFSQKSIWERGGADVDKKYDLPYKLLERYFESRGSDYFSTVNRDYLAIARQKVYDNTGFVDIHSSEHLKSELITLIATDVNITRGAGGSSIHVRGAVPIHGRGNFYLYIVRGGVVIGRWKSSDNTLTLLKEGSVMNDLAEIRLLERCERASFVVIIESILNNSIDKNLSSVVTAGEALSAKIGAAEVLPPIANPYHLHIDSKTYGDFYLHNTLQFNTSHIGTPQEIEEYLDKQWFYYLLERGERRSKRLSEYYTRAEHTHKKRLLERVRERESSVVERFYAGRNFSVAVDGEEILYITEVEDKGQFEIRRGVGIGKYSEEENHKCSCCNSAASKCVKKAIVYDYRGLLYLFNTSDLKNLPEGYQMYMCERIAHDTAASYRNHPFSVLFGGDMCSLYNPRYLELNLYSCGQCHNRLSKDKQDNLIINLEI